MARLMGTGAQHLFLGLLKCNATRTSQGLDFAPTDQTCLTEMALDTGPQRLLRALGAPEERWGRGLGAAPPPLGAHGVTRMTPEGQLARRWWLSQEHFLINRESTVSVGCAPSSLEGHVGSSAQAEVCLKTRGPERAMSPLPSWL